MVKRKVKGPLLTCLMKEAGNYLRFCSSFNRERVVRERLGGLRVGMAIGNNTWLPLYCCGWAWRMLKIATCLELSIISLDLKEKTLQVTKLLKTARLGVWRSEKVENSPIGIFGN